MPPSDPCPSTTVAEPSSFCFLVLSFVRLRFDTNIAYCNSFGAVSSCRSPLLLCCTLLCMYSVLTPPVSISNDADFELKPGSNKQNLPQLHCHGITS